MSADPYVLVGRVAKLVGLDCNVALNDCVVTLESFDVSSKGYRCRIHSDPTQSVKASEIKVDRANLAFFSEVFTEIYPNAPTKSGYDFHCADSGTILDFSQCVSEPASEIPLIFSKSCSVRGARTMSTQPTTIIAHSIMVMIQDSDLVEFEDINFVTRSGCVHCQMGRIIFRRCHFSAQENSVLIGLATARVTFESCSFDNCSDTGVRVGPQNSATFVNCTFRRLHTGVRLHEGASGLLLHCRPRITKVHLLL